MLTGKMPLVRSQCIPFWSTADLKERGRTFHSRIRVQELCESRSGRPGLSVLMNLTVSVDVKQH